MASTDQSQSAAGSPVVPTLGTNMGAVARVPQGSDAHISLTFVSGGDFQLAVAMPICQPRRPSGRPTAQPFGLSEALLSKLKAADAKVVGWLAQDSANPTLFMNDPVGALSKAGIELTSAEQKTLQGLRRAVSDATVIPPGMNVASLTAKVDTTVTADNFGSILPGNGAGGCNCDQKTGG